MGGNVGVTGVVGVTGGVVVAGGFVGGTVGGFVGGTVGGAVVTGGVKTHPSPPPWNVPTDSSANVTSMSTEP